MYIYDHISLKSSYNEKYFKQKFAENQNKYIIFKNLEPAGHKRQFGACTLHAGYIRLQTQTQYM
jgi:hypothetical protein